MPENLEQRIAISYLHWLEQRNEARRATYNTFREYYDGDAGYEVMERAEEFLDLPNDVAFDINICDIPVDTLVERLHVTGFTCDSEEQQSLLWSWWQDNRMDGKQKRVHRNALRDGDAYVIVEWDNERQRPRFVQEQAHNGSFGVEMVYGEDHTPQMAWRYWRVNEPGQAGYVRRKNNYYPDAVVKWISDARRDSGKWQPYRENENDPWPIPWVDGRGEPLGIPVIHFRNKGDDYGVSELKKAIAIQNLLNKAVADLIMSADVDAFSILTLLGFSKSDVKNLHVGPGAIIFNKDAQAKAGRIQPADIEKMMRLVDFFIVKMAQVTRTPVSYFQQSRQMPSAESQKQDENPLLAKIKSCHVPLGNSWEDVLRMGRRLHNTFGPGGLAEDVGISAEWDDPETRNDKAEAETAKLHREVGVPEPFLWRRLGYDQETIDAIMDSAEYRERRALASLNLGMATMRDESQEDEDE